jgi:hypothetical protein
LIDESSATDYNVAQATYIPLPNPMSFRIQSANASRCYQGRNGGGNVNAILKSARASISNAYEYFRNDVLNASEYFLNANSQPRPSVKQNILALALRPVVKRKTAIFRNYRGRQRSALSQARKSITPVFRDSADRSELR